MRPRGGVVTQRTANPSTAGSSPARGLHIIEDIESVVAEPTNANDAEARSGFVGGYMVFYSIGSATGAIASTMIYARAGWLGVSALGATFSAMALFIWLGTRRLPVD